MVKSVDRAIDVMMLVGKLSGPVSLPQITRELNLPRTTAFSIVKTLSARQILEFVEGSGYRLGMLFSSLAEKAMESKNLIGIVHPWLERISRETSETAFLAVPVGEQIVFIDKVEPSQVIRYFAQIGTRRPLYCTAHGKIVLACKTPLALEAYLANTPLEARTSKTIVERAALLKELERIRKQNYSVSDGEFNADAYAISVPVTAGLNGQLIGMVSAVGPKARMKPKRIELAKLMLEIAEKLSAECANVETTS